VMGSGDHLRADRVEVALAVAEEDGHLGRASRRWRTPIAV
jgi:hypothetical protein